MIKLEEHLLEPDVFYSSSINDFKTNAPLVKMPFYKHIPFIGNSKIFVYMRDVCVEKISEDEHLLYYISDQTGKEIMFWPKYNDRHLISFEDLEELQGLRSGDILKDLMFDYNKITKLATIFYASKFDDTPKKDSLLDKLKNLVPQKQLEPAYNA